MDGDFELSYCSKYFIYKETKNPYLTDNKMSCNISYGETLQLILREHNDEIATQVLQSYLRLVVELLLRYSSQSLFRIGRRNIGSLSNLLWLAQLRDRLYRQERTLNLMVCYHKYTPMHLYLVARE